MAPSDKRNDLGNESEFQNRVASGEIKYHSRDSAPDPVSNPQTRTLHFGGVFKSNPTLLIILLDIMLVLVIFLIVFPLIRPRSEVDNFMGYEISLHGYLYEGAVHASLILQPNPSKISDSSAFLEIEFRVLDSDDRIRTTTAPVAPGGARSDTRIVRERLVLPSEYNAAEEVRVRATVVSGEEQITLEKKMRQ